MADEFVLILAVMAISGIAFGIIELVYIIVKNFLRTKEGKTIDRAKGARAHIVLAASLGHYAKTMFAREFTPEGVLETRKWKTRSKGLRKIFHLPQRIDIPDLTNEVEPSKKAGAELTRELAQNAINLATSTVILEHARVPITVAVDDKVVTVGIKGIGALDFYAKLEKVVNLKEKIEALKEIEDFKDVGEVLLALASKVSFVDFNIIRSFFNRMYDQTKRGSKDEYQYQMGYRDGQVKGKDDYKMLMYGGIIIGIVGLAGGILFAFIFGKK